MIRECVTPWASPLRVGDAVWVTVIECGAPVWKKGTVKRGLDDLCCAMAEVDGRTIEVHQHDLRSMMWLRRFVS